MSITGSDDPNIPKVMPVLTERLGPRRASDKREQHFRKLSRRKSQSEIRALQVEGRKLFEDTTSRAG